VTNSGGGGSNGEELERENGVSSGREEKRGAWHRFYRGEGGRGEVGWGASWPSMEGGSNGGGRNGSSEVP
jgi:hypothetical protein